MLAHDTNIITFSGSSPADLEQDRAPNDCIV